MTDKRKKKAEDPWEREGFCNSCPAFDAESLAPEGLPTMPRALNGICRLSPPGLVIRPNGPTTPEALQPTVTGGDHCMQHPARVEEMEPEIYFEDVEDEDDD